jgi:hypothetical protein
VTQAAQWVHLDTLQPWDRNPRNNTAAIPKVAASIRRHGFPTVVTVWLEKNVVLAGHTRCAALRSILVSDEAFTLDGAPGPGFVPARFHSFATDDEAKLYALADNRLSEEATWDPALLAEGMASIVNALGYGALSVAGFNDAEVVRGLDRIADAAAAVVASTTPEPHPPGPGGPDHQGNTPRNDPAPPSAPPSAPLPPPAAPAPAPAPAPAMTLLGILMTREQQTALLQGAHALCVRAFPGTAPPTVEAMAESPHLPRVLLFALDPAKGTHDE